MSGSYRDPAGRAPAAPRELPPEVMRRCAQRGQLLRLFGLLWFVLGGVATVATAVVALVGGFTGPWIGTAVGSGIALSAGVVWLSGWRRKRAGLRVFRDGLETRGEILDVREDLAVRVNGRHPWKVDYTFWTSAAGATRASERVWGEKPALEAGQSVVVLYAEQDPTRSALWSLLDESTS